MAASSLAARIGLDLPIIQAPMAAANGAAMAIAVCETGGLGSLPCAMLSAEQMRRELGLIRQQTARPFNLNFFCHRSPEPDPARDTAWRERLQAYYDEFGLDASATAPAASRSPFDEAACQLVEEFTPKVVSFHFGLPEAALLQRVKDTGAVILSSATSAQEARWLADHGVDAVIAQGYEAGGHRGIFLKEDINTQAGTMALVPQVVDAVDVPVIAAGGIADGRGIVAARALGAELVQIGTAYLFTRQATVSNLHRAALATAADDETALTNLFSGRPARGIVNRVMREVGPMSPIAPAFPNAGTALAPLRKAAEAENRSDFTQLWSGQAAALTQGRSADLDAGDLTRWLAADYQTVLAAMTD